MSQEIFYTSAPAGLKPGSQGFSTVVSTSGMAKNLAEQLEGLSGYRHVFAPHDPNAAHNPVVNMHVKLTVGGRPFQVLSRICDAGIDYTQRTNKFAHHLALETAELSPAGPAAVLAAPGFMQATWDGQPRLLGAGRTPPQLAAAPTVCHAWQQVTGDAGWGGVLAETLGPAVGAPIKRQAVLIFRPGIDCLPLLAEALSLVPPAERWGVTFSTYFTKLPPGIDCRWRCVLEGSPEAAQVQRSAAVLVLDLCRPMPEASGGPLVDGARTGRVSWPKIAPAPRPMQPAAPPMPAAGSATVDELEQALAEESGASLLPEPAGVASESSEPFGVRPPPRKRELPGSPTGMRKASRPKWLWAVGGGLLVAVITTALVTGIAALNSDESKDPIGVIPIEDHKKPIAATKVDDTPKAKKPEEVAAPKAISPAPDKQANSPPTTVPPIVATEAPVAPPPKEPEVKEVKIEPVPLGEIAVDLPTVPTESTAITGVIARGMLNGIKLFDFPKGSHFMVAISCPDGHEFKIFPEEHGWTIRRSEGGAVVATLDRKDDHLMFRWGDTVSPSATKQVRNSIISVSGGLTGSVAFRTPSHPKLLRFTKESISLGKAEDLGIESLLTSSCDIRFYLPPHTEYKVLSSKINELVVSDPKNQITLTISRHVVADDVRAMCVLSDPGGILRVRWPRMALPVKPFQDITTQVHHGFYDSESREIEFRKGRLPIIATDASLKQLGKYEEELLRMKREREVLDSLGVFWSTVCASMTYRISIPVGNGNKSIDLVAPPPPPPPPPQPAPVIDPNSPPASPANTDEAS